MRNVSAANRMLPATTYLHEALRAKIKRDGFLELGLEGRCMEPLLVKGDKARIVERDRYVLGDICLIETSGNAIALHRLIGRQDGIVISKGDRAGCYELVNEKSIIGVVESLHLGDSFRWTPFTQGSFSKWLSVLLSRALCEWSSKNFIVGREDERSWSEKMRCSFRRAVRMLQWEHASRVRKKTIRRSYGDAMLEQQKNTQHH